MTFTLTPNPATKLVTVQLQFDKETAVSVSLLDMVGKPVQTRALTLLKGEVVFDLTALPKGVYMVRVFKGKVSLGTKKLIKS